MRNRSNTSSFALMFVLMGGTISQGLLFSAVIPTLPFLAAASGQHGALVAQLALALPSLGLVLAGLLAGGLIDRFGSRLVLLTALSVMPIAIALPTFGSGPALFLATRLLAGLASGSIATVVAMLVATGFEGPARAKITGYQTAAGSAFGLLFLLGTGLLVARTDWRWSYLLHAAPLVAMLLAAQAAVPKSRSSAASRDQRGTIAALRLLWPVYCAGCLLFMIPVMSGANMPFLLAERGTIDPVTQSAVVACATFGSLAGGLSFGRMQGALGRAKCFALTLAVTASGFAMAGLGTSVVSSGTSMFLIGIGIGLFMPYLWLSIIKLAPEPIRALSLSLLSTFIFSGGFLYPVIVTPLTGLVGIAGTFLVTGGILAVAALGVLATPESRLART